MADLEKLGKYRIETVLGSGAMGVVYKAHDADSQQTFAIKTIRRELLNLDDVKQQRLLERFQNEAVAGQRLRHPNIVAVYDYGQERGLYFIVMEFVDGRPLKAYLNEGYPFKLTEIFSVMHDLLDALDYAHQRGTVHCDIKPANIMLSRGGQIQVTDFGIATLDRPALTRTDAIAGTPSYMAPEQCLGRHVDARADIFSAGATLYQLLTGEKPFSGSSATTIMHRVLYVTPVNPSQLNVEIPAALDAIVLKALAKRPDERFPTARAFAKALQAVADDQPPRSAKQCWH